MDPSGAERRLHPAPAAGHPRFPRIEALRGIAALSVLLFHAGAIGGFGSLGGAGDYVAHLDIGVPLFFVISGFLLYRPFASARLAGTPAIAVPAYLGRRALRILPAYWVALSVLAWVFAMPDVFSGEWWRYYGLVQIYDPQTFDHGLGVAWTLCIEASFYLSLPLFDRAVRRCSGMRPRGSPASTDFMLLAAMFLLSLAFDSALSAAGIDPRWQQNLIGTFDWFALGMGLAVFSLVRPQVSGKLAALSWPLALVLFVAVVRIGTGWDSPILRHVLCGLVAACLFIPAIAQPGAATGWVLDSSLLRWLGLISYSLYLFHATLIPPLLKRGAATWLPVNPWLSLALSTLLVAIPVAAAGYYGVERPAASFRIAKLRGWIARLRTPGWRTGRDECGP